MAEFASLTHKWRATPSIPNTSADKVTKRNRQPVACQQCRARKLKCNKGHPCENCLKRNEGDACVYGKTSPAVPVSTRKDESRSSTLKAQERLNRLEDLVRSMVESSESNDRKPANSTIPTLTRAAADGGSYVGATHWSAILEHINELKNDITAQSEGFDEDPTDNSKPDALFGDHRAPSLQHVLNAYLPPRIQVDRRVSQYFNARYLVIPFLHSKQFQRQYERFWLDTENANPVWVSVLFSICSLAATLNCWLIRPPNESSQIRDDFAAAAGQCLVLGNYSKPQPFVIDALSLFLQCKMFSALDPQKEVALIFSILTRMSYLMGYHRDGSNFPAQFTPFETEMRRRSWAMIKQFELMAAFQMGIPSSITPGTWDTHPPSNLIDADFDEDTRILPPSRPESEITHMLYFMVKTRIMDVYAKICHHAISFPKTQPAYSEILALDAELRKQVDLIPESLRVRPVSQSITDQPSDVMVRVHLLSLWRKALCVLHRRYITIKGSEYSYATCLESASAMCETINDLFPEFFPGGTFEKDGWMPHSLTVQEFLFGLTMLCLMMSVSRKRYTDSGGNLQQWLEQEETQSVLSILDKAQDICNKLKERSKEVRRVSAAVSAMLERFRNPYQSSIASVSSAGVYPGSSSAAMLESSNQAQRVTPDTNAPDISPLTVSDQPTSISISSGMAPPDWYTPDRIYGTPSDAAPFRRGIPSIGSMYPPPDFGQVDFAIDPDVEQSRSNDIALGPFSHIMAGLEMQSLGSIDWASFDQFSSSYGNIDESSTQPEVITTQAPEVDMQTMDYTDWESSPPYNLGGRARDPVTGKSQQP